MSLEEASNLVERRHNDREAAFLEVLRRSVFSHASSPYLKLFEVAGCERGDIESMLATNGLESTLEKLLAAGVYVTFDEFKGRTPIVRNGKEIPVNESAFDNPTIGGHIRARTSGSTGAATRVAIDLAYIRATSAAMMLTYEAHGILDTPTCQWWSILPGLAGGISSFIAHGERL